ncbi:MAG: MBL fold metallo-hydrolase [Clostridia bacterium]|nr:MBL fold metallo-hydrolase [Clostridia bacterium]
MLKFYSLSSGSSGNSAFLRYKNTRILIDCGISARKVSDALYQIGEDSVDAILITHEHGDHIKGLKVFSKKHSVPVYATGPTWENIGSCGDYIPVFNRRISVPGGVIPVGDIDVLPFATSHDSAFSVGYTLLCGDKKIAIATDNGKLTADFANNLQGCYTALIEANYDEKMLTQGPYPYPLKCRISSPVGHMSNHQAGKLACALARSGTEKIILGHLSVENNTPDLAYNIVSEMLREENLKVSLKVAHRYDITDLLE